MKKLFLGIFAMFLFFAGAASAQSQWPMIAFEQDTPFDAKVDDGFGGTWNFSTYIGENISGLITHNISLWRTVDSDYEVDGFGRLKNILFIDNYNLKFDNRSLPVEAGLSLAFYGYLTALHKKAHFYAQLLINPKTGEVAGVMFDIPSWTKDVMLSVPPRCFTLYEDILKKTVRFTPESMKRYVENDPRIIGVYYTVIIVFPAPAAGEPDFLALPAEASAQGK